FPKVRRGRGGPLGWPGGAPAGGPIGVDQPLVEAIPVECP
ncbi:ferredoxin family protein, partial [Mycobacterium tuberculosis]